jgi:lysophospholipase L1-like esterase
VTVVLSEGAVRLFFDPMDHLKIDTVKDPILNHRIAANDGGHDEWGYRNREVPEDVDILAIGDSMTYGVMATSTESWPAQLAKLTGLSVYNAALGGYGPLEYLYILSQRAPVLSPKTVIVALYIGNDLMDAYNLTYSNENWARFRRAGNSDVVDSTLLLPAVNQERFFGGLRDWLSKNSVLYSLIRNAPFFDGVRIHKATSGAPNRFTIEYLHGKKILSPDRRLRFTNFEDPRIVEALNITQRTILEMRDFCELADIDLRIAIVPVMEHVHLRYIDAELTHKQRASMQLLARNLETIHSALTEFLALERIAFTDLFPALESALEKEAIYPPVDAHPNGKGYMVIAEALARDLGLKSN